MRIALHDTFARQMADAESRAAGDLFSREDLSTLRRHREAAEASSRLLQAEARRDTLPGLPYSSGGSGRDLGRGPIGAGDVRGLRDGVSAEEVAAREALRLSGVSVGDGREVGLSPVESRVDRLRLLGNGVKPLQAAYALRTLAARLAARGSAGAALLIRMMGEA